MVSEIKTDEDQWKIVAKYQGANQIIEILMFRGVDRLVLADALETFKLANPI